MESIPYEIHGENLRKSVQTNLSTEISQKFDVSMIWYVSYQRVFGNCLIPVMVLHHRCQWLIFAKSSFFRIPMPLIDQSFFTAYWYQSRFQIASFYYKGSFLGISIISLSFYECLVCKYLLGKGWWITMWEELIVNFCEFVFGQFTGWAIFEESFMPMRNFFFRDWKSFKISFRD